MFHFKNKEIKDLFQWSKDIVLKFDPIYAGEEVHFSNNKTNSLNKNIINNMIYYLILNNNSLYSNLLIIYIFLNSIYLNQKVINN